MIIRYMVIFAVWSNPFMVNFYFLLTKKTLTMYQICNVPSKEIHWDRLCILEDKTVDPSCLYIHPVRLDGSDIDFAFCTRCHSFLPKSHAFDAAKVQSRRGQVSESHGVHRCHLGGKRAARIREEELSGGMSIPQNLEFRLVISIRCYHFLFCKCHTGCPTVREYFDTPLFSGMC